MKIRVIGSGSWATALAQVLADNHQDVKIYGISQTEVDDINNNHQNSTFYPGVDINPALTATTDINVVKDADVVLLGVPVMALESVCLQIKDLIDHPVYVINVAKGFHPDTHERLSVVIKRLLGEHLIDVISLIGPSHAEEVILRLLTCVNSVCENEESAKVIQELFSNDYFRVYTNTDVIGAEIAAALKNVMAIASGMITGLEQGDNARAALMTRGLYEITRFGLAQGGKQETFLGLNGVGDLIVTCSSLHSRNFQAGLAIGKSGDAKAFLASNKKTTEGVNTTRVVHLMAKEMGVEMPITEQVYRILFEGLAPQDAISELMNRSLKREYNLFK